MKPSLEEIARRLMQCPAAPFHEGHVLREAVRLCEEHHLSWELDSFDNLLISVNRGGGKPLVLAAHLDHPGFVMKGRLRDRAFEAEFLGGVGDDYFRPGIKLRLLPGNRPVRLGKRLEKRRFEIVASSRISEEPEFAIWDLPAFNVKGKNVVGRACDDLIGAATILHVLIRLAEQEGQCNVVGVLTRAEEVGFYGALALARSRKLPKGAFIISLETSREMPPVTMGGGVIVRVGDRTSVFDSTGSRFLAEIAAELGKEGDIFRFQRALMSGGTCEATAYQEFGYRCGAVCVALGNYHNCAANGKIAAEFVSLSDVESMSALLERAARDFGRFKEITGKLPTRLIGYAKEGERELRRKRISPVEKRVKR